MRKVVWKGLCAASYWLCGCGHMGSAQGLFTLLQAHPTRLQGHGVKEDIVLPKKQQEVPLPSHADGLVHCPWTSPPAPVHRSTEQC